MQRILVVEDDLDTAQTFAIMLSEMGHQVEFAINGRAALEVASNFRPHIVFVDMLLPDADGSDLAYQLRMRAGCDAFLRKPVDGPSLLDY